MLLSMLACNLSAYDFKKDGIYYNYKNGSSGASVSVTYKSVDYYDYGGSYYISDYTGNVIIPESVTYNGKSYSVTSIDYYAFENCSSLTSIIIPNSVTSIGGYAFSGCTGLTSITIPNSVTYIDNGVFTGCSGLTSITIPSSVTFIGPYAFSGCTGLTSVTIPNSVKAIDYYAFENCSSLTSITIPNSVTYIDNNVFSGCRLAAISVESNNTHYDSRENSNAIIETSTNTLIVGCNNTVIPNSVTSIGDVAFSGCSGLTSVIIPNSVTSIGRSAFRNCTGLTSLTIPNSVTSIGDDAFYGCTGLTSVTIPNSVHYIGEGAFYDCTGLNTITIPNSVTSIGDYAFYCKNLAEVVSLIKNPFVITGKSTSSGTFHLNTFNNATLYVPVGTKEKYKNTEGWKDFLFIEEGTGSGGGTTPEPEQCAKPTISYANGKLMFSCATEGATCQYTITDRDIKSGIGDEVELCVTYQVSVYATKAGYNNSETATATLCWVDVEPTITFGTGATALGSIEALPVLIQTNGPVVSITGAAEGTEIAIYDVAGKLVGSAKASVGTTDISTTLRDKDIAIVKIGSKSVKVVMK